jgi:selenide,water dikinase
MGAQKHLVLIGGGHSHALLLKQWAQAPVKDVKISIINPGNRAAYSGMLPGYIAGHYSLPELQLNMETLARKSGAQFIQSAVTHIDTSLQSVQLKSGDTVTYDIASIDIGITTSLKNLSGFSEFGIAAKPLDHFAQCWQQFLQEVKQGSKRPQVAILGGGVAGAELALAMAYALRNIPETTIDLIDRSEILSEMHPRTRQIVLQKLKAYPIRLHSETTILRLSENHVHIQQGTVEESAIPSSFTLSAAGARPYEWLQSLGSDTNPFQLHEGFICVDTYLRSTDPKIYAVGDCAHMTATPRPKAGVYAVRQAPILYKNLVAELQEKPEQRQAYQPQKDYLKLMSLGEKKAVADKLGIQFSGKWVWNLKNRIDQKFMSQFKGPQTY